MRNSSFEIATVYLRTWWIINDFANAPFALAEKYREKRVKMKRVCSGTPVHRNCRLSSERIVSTLKKTAVLDSRLRLYPRFAKTKLRNNLLKWLCTSVPRTDDGCSLLLIALCKRDAVGRSLENRETTRTNYGGTFSPIYLLVFVQTARHQN